jgi:hypothetical protein
VMYLETPGHIFDAGTLASILAFSPAKPFMSLQSRQAPEQRSLEMIMIRPSISEAKKLSKKIGKNRAAEDDLIQASFPYTQDTEILASSKVLPHTSDLRIAPDDFNATFFLDSNSYIRIVDPELPGPEFDVPYPERVAARPTVPEAEAIWSRVYDGFRLGRMSICGLDLEPLRKQ